MLACTTTCSTDSDELYQIPGDHGDSSATSEEDSPGRLGLLKGVALMAMPGQVPLSVTPYRTVPCGRSGSAAVAAHLAVPCRATWHWRRSRGTVHRITVHHTTRQGEDGRTSKMGEVRAAGLLLMQGAKQAQRACRQRSGCCGSCCVGHLGGSVLELLLQCGVRHGVVVAHCEALCAPTRPACATSGRRQRAEGR